MTQLLLIWKQAIKKEIDGYLYHDKDTTPWSFSPLPPSPWINEEGQRGERDGCGEGEC